MAFSVKGDSVTVLVDCGHQMTKKLDRTISASVATDGLILLGVQLVEGESFFVGDLQQLLLADTPDEAYNLCTKYSPGCDAGSGFISGSSFVSEEVSGGSLVSSSAEVTRSSSSSFSSSGGSASRTSSATVLSGGASTMGSSRYDVNLSKERVVGMGSASSTVIGSGGRQMSRGGSSTQSGGQLSSGGMLVETIPTGSRGQGGARGQLVEIREDIYGWYLGVIEEHPQISCKIKFLNFRRLSGQ